MNRFQKENLIRIKERFQEETGVQLNPQKCRRPYGKAMVLLTTVLLCGVSLTAFGFQQFSGLAGDELAIGAVYQGNGIVTVTVENQSDKDLHFQPKLKLMKWNSGEEIPPHSQDITFTNTEIPPHGEETMTIDLSSAYDIALLEQPLTDDSYYLVLTNNNFIFGQDWMCSIAFAENIYTMPQTPSVNNQIETDLFEKIPKSLRFYFEGDSTDTEERRKLNAAYEEAYSKLFGDIDGNIIPSVSPVRPGNRMDTTAPYLHIKDSPTEEDQRITMQWHSTDSRFKLLATEGEHALVLSANLPLTKYQNTFTDLPLFFLLTYEKNAASAQDYAFIYGQIVPFDQLAPYEVYTDDTYVCYEISPFLYTDLDRYLQDFAKEHPEIDLDETTMEQTKQIYQYYRDNLPDLIYFK